MDKYKITQIICWSVGIVVIVGLAVWFLISNRFGIINSNSYSIENLRGPYEEQGRYNVSTTDINSLDIDWVAGGIILTPYTGSDIQIIEYAQRKLDEDEVLYKQIDASCLKLMFTKEEMGFNKRMPSKKLEIFVPEALAASIQSLYIDNTSSTISISKINSKKAEILTVSGTCNITEMNADELEIESTSGDIELSDIKAPSISLQSVSGEIYLSGIKVSELEANSTSGEMLFADVETDNLTLDTVSGDVSFEGSFLTLKANSISGCYNITVRMSPNSFDIDTVSGDVNIVMPAIEGLNIDFDTVSGDIRSEIPLISKGDTNYMIDTISGDVEINEYVK